MTHSHLVGVQVTVSMTKEVADYYKQYLRSAEAWTMFVDKMLERYELESLPPVTGEKYTQKTITVTNEYFVSLYNEFGAKSKRCSIARLLALGKDIDIFSEEEFQQIKDIKVTTTVNSIKIAALTRVVRELNAACAVPTFRHDEQEAYLQDVRDFVQTYRDMLIDEDNKK